MNNGRLVSPRFPYLPVTIQVQRHRFSVEALLDTGFDEDVVIPTESGLEGQPSYGRLGWALADRSRISAPYYLGFVEVGGMGSYPAVVTVLATMRSSGSVRRPISRSS